MNYSTEQARHDAKRRAQRFTELAVEGRREDADTLLTAAETFLQHGLDAGLDRAYLTDTARGFHDAITNLVAAMNKDLDNAGIEGTVKLDLEELDAIIAEIEKP